MMRIHTNLSDGHVYVFKRWVLDYLVQRETISTIQGELVPVLTKAQFRNLDAPTGPYASALARFSLALDRLTK